MALNLIHLSRSASLFVANQLRVCGRYKSKYTQGRCHNYLLPWGHTGNPAFISRRKRCAIYQHSLTGFRRDIQNLNSAITIQNLHKNQIRGTHTGNKTDSFAEYSAFAIKAHKNKKSLPRSKSSIDCMKLNPNKDRLKICRPRIVSSSVTNLNSDFKMMRILKSMEKNCPVNLCKNIENGTTEQGRNIEEIRKVGTHQPFCEKDTTCVGCGSKINKYSECLKLKDVKRHKSVDESNVRKTKVNEDFIQSISKAAKEMGEWLNAVRKHVKKFEHAERAQKKKDDLLSSKTSNGNMSLQKSQKKANISHSFGNLSLTKTQNGLKISNNNSTNFTGKDKNVSKIGQLVSAKSNLGKSLDKINQEISRMKKERNAVSDLNRPRRDGPSNKPKDSEELLEVRPTIVENIKPDLNIEISKKNNIMMPTKNSLNLVAAQALSAIENKNNKEINEGKGFILVDQINRQMTKSTLEPTLTGTDSCSQKGFILVNPDAAASKMISTSSVSREEKGFVMVNCDDKEENVIRRSKQDNNNFVLEYDNPLSNLKNTATSAAKCKTNEMLPFNHSVNEISERNAHEEIHSVSDRRLGCIQLESNKENPGYSIASNQNQNLIIGTSDSSEELQHARKSPKSSEELQHARKSPKSSEELQHARKSPKSSEELQHARKSPKYEKEHSPLFATQSKKQHLNTDSRYINVEPLKGSKILAAVNDVQSLKVGKSIEIMGDKSKSASKKDDNLIGNSQENNESATSCVDTCNDAIENEKKQRQMYNLEHFLGKRNIEDKTVTKLVPFVDPIMLDQFNKVPKEITAKNKIIRKTTSADNLNKSNMKVSDEANFNRNTFEHGKSQISNITELRPDLRSKKTNKSLSCSSIGEVKVKAEPQLYVKPEELSKKVKKNSAARTDIYSTAPKILTTITDSGNSKPENTLHLRWKDNSENIQKKQCQVSTLPSSDRKDTINQSMSLSPDMFHQMPHNSGTETAPQNKANVESTQKEMISTHPSRQDKEVMKAVREQLFEDLKKKNKSLGQTSVYSPYFQSNGNCLVGKQDTNSSSGEETENVVIIQSTESKASQTTQLTPSTQPFKKKSEHLPTMGMAERLLAASKTSLTTFESSEVRNSDSSMTVLSDATITQGTAEKDDFPEVDQFEEWIQTSMSEADKDKKNTVFQNSKQEIDRTATNIHRERNIIDKSRSPSTYEGSDVDGPSISKTNQITKQVTDRPIFENKPLRDLSFKERSNSYQHLRNDAHAVPSESLTNAEKLGKKKSYGSAYGNSTDSLMREELSKHISKQIQGGFDKQQFRNDVLNTAFSGVNTPPRGDALSTLNITKPQTIGSSLKSKLLGSMDGLATMTLVEELPSASGKTLKSTLKISNSRDRGEEKRVSFLAKSSRNDNCQIQDNIDYTIDVGEQHISISSNRPLGGSSIDDKGSGENDLRKELSDQRKRTEMNDRIKLITEHTKQIREYEAVLAKYRNIIGKLKDDKLKVVKDQSSQPQNSSEV